MCVPYDGVVSLSSCQFEWGSPSSVPAVDVSPSLPLSLPADRRCCRPGNGKLEEIRDDVLSATPSSDMEWSHSSLGMGPRDMATEL